MRARRSIILSLFLLTISSAAWSQTATLTENITGESNVRDASDYTITITITGDTLNGDIGTSAAATSDFLNGMTGSSSAWDDVVAGIATSDVVLSEDDTVATITISQYSAYYINSDDIIDFVIPGASLYSGSPIDAAQDIIILNEQTSLSYGGSLADGEPESGIRNGSNTFTLGLSGNTWRADITSNVDAMDSIRGMFSGAAEFAMLVNNLGSSDLSVSGGGSLLTITFDAAPAYVIGSDETVGVDVPSFLLDLEEEFVSSVTSFSISDEDPEISLSGDFTGIGDEADIRSGSYELDISVQFGSWAADVDTDPVKTSALINGLTCAPSSSGFDDLVSAVLGSDQGVSSVSLAGNTVTIAIPQKTDFDITDDITLSLEVPAGCFAASGSSVTESDFLVISNLAPYFTLSSDPASLSESNLDESELILTLFEDEFIAGPFSTGAFTLDVQPSGIPGLSVKNDFTRVSDTQLRVRLNYTGFDFDGDRTIGLSVGASQFLGSSAVSASNTVGVAAVVEPEILDVTIPNQPIGNGEEVTAFITVEDAGTAVFNFVQGTIAGEDLYDLSKVNNTTYTIKFSVDGSSTEYAAGDDIPVTSLQLRNGAAPGNIYTDVISQGNDPIDVTPPTISLISFNNGIYKIGSQVTATIGAGEPDLDFVESSTTINQVSMTTANVTGIALGGGIYQLNYVVASGDDDVPAPGPIDISVVLEDYAGNTASYGTVSGVSPVIDANRPEIASMNVMTTGTVIAGQTVEITIDAGEAGLTLAEGTQVNNVYAVSGRLSLTDHSDGTYTLSYDIAMQDNGVESGNLEASVRLSDGAGNISFPATSLLNNNVAIVTEGPDAFIFGGGDICDGGSSRVFININGEGPFDVTIQRNGSFYEFLDDIPADHSLDVAPPSPGVYNFTISAISDALGNPGASTGSAEVFVHPNPSVSLDLPRDIYQVTEDSVSLSGTGTPAGGIFSGAGVLTADELFSPKIVGLDNSPTQIFYSYTDPVTGCSGTASQSVSIIEGQAQFTTFPENELVCDGDPNVSIAAVNNYMYDGRFDLTLKNQGDYNFAFSEDPTRDSIVISTDQLIEGQYTVTYHYRLEITGFGISIPFQLTGTFFVEKLDRIKWISRPEATICNDQAVIPLETNLDDPNISYAFSGSGVTGEPSFGYSFTPADADLGENRIDYTMISNRGCSRDSFFLVEVYDVPDVDFTPKSICIPSDGGPVGFENVTNKETLVKEWRWEFGDVNSGQSNTDTLLVKTDPVHLYTAPGTRNVSLEILTNDGCISKQTNTYDFGDKPRADFRWRSDCYIADLPVVFVNESFTEREWLEPDKDDILDSIAFTYRIYDAQMNLMDSLFSGSIEDLEYHFDQLDKFNIKLIAVNDLMCSDTLTGTLELKPTTSLLNDNYFESFDTDGFWSDDSASDLSSWIHDVPDFSGFEAEPENRAWYTKYSEQNESIEERSWLQSPCFDFRDTERPMIRMDIMKSFDFNRDGAVLQYSLDNGENWNTVGNIGEGINWYNSFDIKEQPGGGDGEGSSIGWSGSQVFDPDTNWVTVAHDLDVLRGEESVIFGLFYATDGEFVVGNQGIAVDNVYIGERTKKAVIEHFTNSGEPDAISADQAIDDFIAANNKDVVSLQYHTSYPDEDPLNLTNPAPASARSLHYGVTEIPFAIMDGGAQSGYRFDFSPAVPDVDILKELTLEDPLFSLKIEFQLYDNRLRYQGELVALTELDSMEVNLHVAVVEREVTGQAGKNGDTEFRNVVLDMVPSPAGIYIEQGWLKDDSESFSGSWNYHGVEDLSDLLLVAFVQDRTSKKILQVTTADESMYGLPVEPEDAGVLKVYPNPFRDRIFIELAEPADMEGRLTITDISGRIILKDSIRPGASVREISTGHWEPGTYILFLEESGKARSVITLVRID